MEIVSLELIFNIATQIMMKLLNISQQYYALRMGYNRSYQGFGGGIGATLEYELSFKIVQD